MRTTCFVFSVLSMLACLLFVVLGLADSSGGSDSRSPVTAPAAMSASVAMSGSADPGQVRPVTLGPAPEQTVTENSAASIKIKTENYYTLAQIMAVLSVAWMVGAVAFAPRPKFPAAAPPAPWPGQGPGPGYPHSGGVPQQQG